MASMHESDDRALRRLLANGPLDAVPKRPTDQDLLVRLAIATLEPEREYGERELNEHLEAWLATFTEPYGIDHVTLRRMMVDSRLLLRTPSGSRYMLSPDAGEALESLRDVHPAQVLEQVREERAERKRRHAG